MVSRTGIEPVDERRAQPRITPVESPRAEKS
jgi:hypothetical protein